MREVAAGGGWSSVDRSQQDCNQGDCAMEGIHDDARGWSNGKRRKKASKQERRCLSLLYDGAKRVKFTGQTLSAGATLPNLLIHESKPLGGVAISSNFVEKCPSSWLFVQYELGHPPVHVTLQAISILKTRAFIFSCFKSRNWQEAHKWKMAIQPQNSPSKTRARPLHLSGTEGLCEQIHAVEAAE